MGGTTTIENDVIINGKLTVNDDANFTSVINSNGKDIGDGHQHAQGNDGNGDVEQNIVGVL